MEVTEGEMESRGRAVNETALGCERGCGVELGKCAGLGIWAPEAVRSRERTIQVGFQGTSERGEGENAGGR